YLAALPPVYAGMGLTMLGTPAMAFLTPEEIHDVPHHANDPGRARYTNAMLDQLCRYVACRE
ncbi:MAG TPA: hypothetical protein VK515_00455, partial [Rhizomicrobium sp.]|nr:hypothetical protein [Rhizomicrobium sp.]